jgi:AcrR family transcriptional regulator
VPRISAEARRTQFVEAALKVMSREGLDRATTRRIAEVAGAPQGAFHYAFRDKNELLTAVLGEVVSDIETILREAVNPERGLLPAIDDALRAFWSYVVSDDGMQLMQYELTIFCRRTEGFEWLAEWQYARYASVAREVFGAAAAHDNSPPAISVDELTNFVVAAMDGLILQYEVSGDHERSERDLANVIKAATLLASHQPLPAKGR